MENVKDLNEVENVLMRERERGRESRSFEMECCIFKIPTEVSIHNDKVYSPHAFSIGPFHYSNPRTTATHTIKLRYFDDFLSRFENGTVTPKYLIEIVNKDYDQALRHYDRRVVNMSHEELIKILVLDACFLIELFIKNKFLDQETEEADPIFSVPRLRQHLNHDLILLENQLPWMVVKTLFDETIDKYCAYLNSNLTFISLNFFSPLVFDVTGLEFHCTYFRAERVKHLLDLMRQRSLTSLPTNESTTDQMDAYDARLDLVMHSATALDESGIKIQPVDFVTGSIFNVEFKAGVLTIPQVKIHDTTEALLRNLVALELYCPNYDLKVTSYVKLFDDLVQTTADMKLLCDKKVVHNMLRLDKATSVFNQTSDGNLDVKRNYYYKLIRDVDEYRQRKRRYCMRRWRVYRQELKRVYFTHPWASISTFAASLVVFLTLFQTVLAVLSYVKDSNESCPCLSGKQP